MFSKSLKLLMKKIILKERMNNLITNVKEIHINKAILHIINAPNSHFNSELLPKSNSKFNAFLINHIKSSARRMGRKAANFLNPENNSSCVCFNSMFDSDQAFIDYSIKLAKRLNIICRDGGFGPYDLIFCEYQNNSGEKYIAALLLEFSIGFFHEINDTAALIKQLTVLASSNSGLKKCALVQKYNPNSDYNIVINDKNNADFFISAFLKAEESMDNRKSTQTFIEETIIWVNQTTQRADLSNEIKSRLENVKSQCITSITDLDKIDIEAFQTFLFCDELAQFKEEYNTHLEEKGLINKDIILTEDVTKEYKVQKIKLDTNAELKIPIDLLSSDGYTDYYTRTVDAEGRTVISLKGHIVDENVKSK